MKKSNAKKSNARRYRTSRKRLINKLNRVFGLYIRMRDNWTCVTCGVRIRNTKEMHAGHYIGRNCKQLLFCEYNVHAQCRSCNFAQRIQDDNNKYTLAIIDKYGVDILDWFETIKEMGNKYTNEELVDMIGHYEIGVSDLKTYEGEKIEDIK